MAHRPSRKRTGNPATDAKIDELLDDLNPSRNRDQLFEIFAAVAQLATEDAERLDLKITNAAVRELITAFRAFKPYANLPKVTIFGSARTLPSDPLYAQAHDTARLLSQQGWMIVTGAGPGIMAAGLEGAGIDHAFGINIKLPFEQAANPFIKSDPKLVTMKYFFTRKLMLIKESDGFVVLPGGFGTLDETFELLTLVQTGKAEPTPIVLLDVPGGSYWTHWKHLVDQVQERGLISAGDERLFTIVDTPEAAAKEVLTFYRNYHSRRYVGSRLVMRLQCAPTEDELRMLNERFSWLCATGDIQRTEPLSVEVTDNDQLNLARIVFQFDRVHHGGLRELIDALNHLDSAPSGQPDARHYQAPHKPSTEDIDTGPLMG